MTARTYAAMYDAAAAALSRGLSCVLDAAFLTRNERKKALSIAEEYGAGFVILKYPITDAETRANLAARGGSDASDGNYQIYREQLGFLDELDEDEEDRAIELAASLPLPAKIDKVMEVITHGKL